MDHPTDLIQVITTTGREGEAQHLASLLVEKRLAACVQVVGPIRSTYRWQGTVETSCEWQVQAKTSQSLFASVEAEILRIHSYELPEIIALPIFAGSKDYLAWLHQELSSSPEV